LKNYAHENVILPDPTNLQRIVNRTRASQRPKHPTNLLFDLDMPNIPKHFLRGDILHGLGEREKRHLIFATKKKQLRLLRNCQKYLKTYN
jgi:hypothetical protein